MKIVRSISLSEGLWERVEKARGRESRSGFVERTLEGALDKAGAPAVAPPEPAREPAREPVVYMCPEERCFQTAAKPGVCPSHRSRRMVRAS